MWNNENRQLQIPNPAARRGARVDRVPDGARTTADAGVDRGAGVSRVVRTCTSVLGSTAATTRLLRVRVRGLRCMCCVRRRRQRRSAGLLRMLPWRAAAHAHARARAGVTTLGARRGRRPTGVILPLSIDEFSAKCI